MQGRSEPPASASGAPQQEEQASRELQKLLGEGALGQLVQLWVSWWRLPEAAAVQLSRTGERLVQPSQAPPAGLAPRPHMACAQAVV